MNPEVDLEPIEERAEAMMHKHRASNVYVSRIDPESTGHMSNLSTSLAGTTLCTV